MHTISCRQHMGSLLPQVPLENWLQKMSRLVVGLPKAVRMAWNALMSSWMVIGLLELASIRLILVRHINWVNNL